MNTTPDLNRIGSMVSSWQRGVVTTEEAMQFIHAAMDPANHLPASELIPLPQADESMRQVLAVNQIAGIFLRTTRFQTSRVWSRRAAL